MSKIINEAVADLTRYNAKALSKIKSIQNVALLLIAEDAPPEYYEALAGIKKKNVATTLRLPTDKQVFQKNGVCVITPHDIPENSVVMVNGICVLKGFDHHEGNSVVHINGIFIKSKGCAAKIGGCNGMTVTMPDDDFECSIWENEVTVDEEMLRHLPPKTLIICENKLFLDESVRAETIEEKDIRFLSANKIIAPKGIISCVKARSTVGNKIVEAQEYTESMGLKEEILADMGRSKKRRFFGRKK